MGWVAFALFTLEAIALVTGVFIGGPLFVANLKAAAPIISTLIWAQVALIGTYLGVSLTEALKKP